ncbi:MAG: indolepyruvate ferredoxin oxidoreductase family protein [Granulosicoccus sp.]|nr:indolepyruvate ferredoxin oxidoreductase family protein [Granulosicoccus sp.]
MGTSHKLEDKYTALKGSVFMSGTQALVRLPMAQMRRDRAAGLNTAAFVTGYRGSPLGAYDQQLQLAKAHLDGAGVHFQPGVNEDLAATAIWGTQQVPLADNPTRQGVVGYWYGKGPGVDRCGDVFKHGNAAGSSTHGGVLCFAGDDHTAKSSTLPHQSDHAFMSAVMPVLYPSSIHEFIDVGLFGIAMSRYSGCWVGYKVISDTIETSAVVQLSDENKSFVIPAEHELPEGGLNLRWPDPPLVQDDRLQEHKAYAALAFARANRIDQVILDSPRARFGIVATGKAFEDVRQALTELGIDDEAASAIGLRLYKVRMPWPLEPEGIRAFSDGLDEVLIIEERREIIEHQIKQQLFNWRSDVRPRIVGKFDENDMPFLPLSAALSTSRVARALATRLLPLDFDESLKKRMQERLEYLQRRAHERAAHQAPIERQPWFCSGCPHNTSTKVPEGSRAMAGIGCHYMVQWMDRNTDTFTQMGGEGVPWTSISQYCNENHRFVNLGDGTYFHSGLLAVRASVSARVNVTYKILYNDAVAMTGGQSVDGDLSAQAIAHQLHHEGVAPIYLVSDEPELFSAKTLPVRTIIKHRDELDSIMRTLRECDGCSAIVYVQTCAAEKRRRRKRGLLDDPPRRVFINSAVCEGCGDCSEQSNCVSIEPLNTAMGRKRQINQSSCNKDFSCLKGFCPSFVTIEGGQLRKHKPEAQQPAGTKPAPARSDLPVPQLPALSHRPWNIAITGVGGTGVLTIGSLLGMAAHIDGAGSVVLDMAGLAQKGGAVISHVRLASKPSQVTSPHIVAGSADLLIAADAVVAASRDGKVLCDSARTVAVLNRTTAPVAGFVRHRDLNFKNEEVENQVASVVISREHFHPFTDHAKQCIGDSIATNIMMLGYAWQSAQVPLSLDAITQAIELNGVAVAANLDAFHWGRMLATDPKSMALEPPEQTKIVEFSPVPQSLEAIVKHRAAHLTEYQNTALSDRYVSAVKQFEKQSKQAGVENGMSRTVARHYAKLLAYKDEYEVARLYCTDEFKNKLESVFTGDYSLNLYLAPPLLSRIGSDGRAVKRRFGPWVLTLFRWLKRGKVLRGTAFDPFGYTEERRAERSWIDRYEQDIKEVSSRLPTADEQTLSICQAILDIPEQIRGFGPVKKRAMQDAERTRQQLLSQLHTGTREKNREAA